MRGSGGRREALRVACVCASLVVATSGFADQSRVRLKGAPGMAVRRAIEGARLRLEEPGCPQVFSDFGDREGRPLQDNLDSLGVDRGTYLGCMVFYADASQRTCASGQ